MVRNVFRVWLCQSRFRFSPGFSFFCTTSTTKSTSPNLLDLINASNDSFSTTHARPTESTRIRPVDQPNQPSKLIPELEGTLHEHIGRGISRIYISPAEQSHYESIASQFPSKWGLPGRRLPCRPFEHDGLQRIHEESHGAQTLLEIRDAQVPSSSHHPSFTRLAKHRLHLIVYTHADKLNSNDALRVKKWTKQAWPESKIYFVDSRESREYSEPFEGLRSWLMHYLVKKGGIYCALTVGVPNVGKSSVLLAMMRTFGDDVSMRVGRGRSDLIRKMPEIDNIPGVTKDLAQYLLNVKPRMWCLDVPGSVPPAGMTEERPEVYFGLAAADCVELTSDAQVYEVAEYILYAMNRDRNFAYVKVLDLEQPKVNLKALLSERHIGAEGIIKLFREGAFGSQVLDDLRKPYEKFVFKDEHFKNGSVSGVDFDAW